MTRLALPATQDIMPAGMDLRMQVWRDTSKGALFVRFLWAKYRNEVALVSAITGPNRFGQYVMIVKRMK